MVGHRKMDLFARVVAIPVNHCVYHTFPNRHSQLVQIVLMEADFTRSAQNRRFRHFHTVQGRTEQYFTFCHSFSVEAVLLGKAAAEMNVHSKILNARKSRRAKATSVGRHTRCCQLKLPKWRAARPFRNWPAQSTIAYFGSGFGRITRRAPFIRGKSVRKRQNHLGATHLKLAASSVLPLPAYFATCG